MNNNNYVLEFKRIARDMNFCLLELTLNENDKNILKKIKELVDVTNALTSKLENKYKEIKNE